MCLLNNALRTTHAGVLPLFKIKYPEINSENSWIFHKISWNFTKGSILLYISCIMMLFFSESNGTICKPYPPKHISHRLFHGIPCNRYSIQIHVSWKNILKFFNSQNYPWKPQNSWKLLNFGRSGNADPGAVLQYPHAASAITRTLHLDGHVLFTETSGDNPISVHSYLDVNIF